MVDISENKIKFFHFTEKKNLEEISKNGLVPKIGDNAQGVENTPKVFFSEGVDGACKCINAWLKWFITRYTRAKIDQTLNELKTESYAGIGAGMLYEFFRQDLERKYTEDVKTGRVETEEAKLASFEKLYEEHSERVYLTLDIQEGKEFSYNDTDDVKMRCINNPKRKNFIEYAYGKIDKLWGLEKWNMHAFNFLTIPYEKLDMLSTNGKTDGISIVKKFHEIYNEKQDDNKEKLELLDEWIEYVKEREKQDKNNNLKEYNNQSEIQ